MERLHLLPSNASQFERDLSLALDPSPELAPSIEALRGFKFDPPDAIVPYLIIEYGLSEVADYLPTLRKALAEGIAWQRLRGSMASIHKALGWINKDGIIEENPVTRMKWWWFQVHLPLEQRSSGFVDAMIALARASKPERSEFARVTAGYDIRGFTLNGKRWNSAMWNSWSGVRRAPGEPVLSLRVHHPSIVEYADWGAYPVDAMVVTRMSVLDASIPTEQRSGFSSFRGASFADASDSASVPFNNAPFSATPFGDPSTVVQTGY